MFRAILIFFAWMLAPSVVAQQTTFPHGYEFYLLSAEPGQQIEDLPTREHWQPIQFAGIPFTSRDYWVQADFHLGQASERHLGVFISLLGAYQAYWDGQLIGKNGQLGSSQQQEKPGEIEGIFLLRSDQIQPGKHTLTIRASSHYIPEQTGSGLFYTFVDDYETLVTLTFKRAAVPMIMSGALLFIALYCLFLYFRAWRERSYLFFGALCLVVLSLYVVESWRGLWGYTYDWHIPRLQLVLALSCAAGVLMSLFYGHVFKLKTRQISVWAGLTLVAQVFVLVTFDGYDSRSLYVFMLGFSVSLLITLQAIFLKRDNARLMLSALILLVAPIYLNTRLYMEQYFFISFTVLIGFMLYSLTATFRNKQQQLIQSKLNAARLELELVKRNLQPHFILNTLTAVEEWIEESPKTAVAFVQALADEFRFMAQLSSRKTVSLQEEVALCQAHLSVMGYRANVQYTLELLDLRLDSQLPPGILLTLMENAISHNHYCTGDVTFSLKQTDYEQDNLLIFTAPVVERSRAKPAGTGTGMKYVEARMTEQFAQNWHLEQGFEQQQWQVKIRFPQIDGVSQLQAQTA